MGKELAAHTVKTVQDMGWHGIKNGRLLTLAQTHFDVFITGDKNLSFQQNLSRFSIAGVVLQAESIRLKHTQPLMAKVAARLPTLQPGELAVIG